MTSVGQDGYQETELGWIPTDWSITTLGKTGQCIRGVSYKPEQLHETRSDTSVTLLRSNNIKDARVNFSQIQFVSKDAVNSDQLIQPMDIAICMSNGSKALVGKSGVIKYEHILMQPQLTVGSFCAIYRPKNSYAFHIFQSIYYQNSIDVQLSGSAINNLKNSDIEGILFPYPPLPEQKKIATILTVMNDKLDVISRQIETTKNLKLGLMQALFSRGVGTQHANGRWAPHTEFKDSGLGEIPSNWIAGKLGSYALKVGSGVTPKGGSDAYLESGIPLIRSQNVLIGKLSLEDVAFISDEQHLKMNNSALKPKDVLLNITGASIGRCAILPADFQSGNVNQHVCIIRTAPSLDPYYLCHYLNSDAGQKQIEKFQAGGNREGLNYQQIRSFDIPFIPLPEQQKIAEILDGVDAKLAALLKKRIHYQTLKRGLMQKLLTGEWRVKLDAITGEQT